MKDNTHPNYKTITVTCNCGATFLTGSTKNVTDLHVDVCSKCHNFYTGKQKAIESGGRIKRFNDRYNRNK